MMQPEQVIQSVLDGHPQNGWRIFRFNITNAVLRIVYNLAMVGVLAGGAWVMITTKAPNGEDQSQLGMGLFVGMFALGFLYPLIKNGFALIYSTKNMIVLTDTAAVKSWNGKIVEYPYNTICQVRFTSSTGRNMYPQFFLDFVDSRTNKIVDLARNNVFGSINVLYDSLKNKVS
ncbi:hypothetical protein KBD59_01575 [Candidatus Gracilibacteria bacterium]|nr:hypothetical protein [Candidatus Gracilibacteria bacterium]